MTVDDQQYVLKQLKKISRRIGHDSGYVLLIHDGNDITRIANVNLTRSIRIMNAYANAQPVLSDMAPCDCCIYEDCAICRRYQKQAN